MTTPVEMSPYELDFTPHDELGPLDWAVASDGQDLVSQEINDRRAQQESPETLRLVRAL